MRRAVTVLVAGAAAAVFAASAAGQGGGELFGIGFDFSTPGLKISTWDLPVTVDGSVVVRFEGADRHGTIAWTPGPGAQLTIVQAATRSGVTMDAFFGSVGLGEAQIAAHVERASGGTCSDTAAENFHEAATSEARGGFRFYLVGDERAESGLLLTETRCGGPLSSDLRSALPSVFVKRAQAVRGGFDIDLRRTAPLTAPGMTGTVESSVVIHVGKRRPAPSRTRVPQAKPGGSRQLDVRYRIESIRGSASGRFEGGGDVCSELDSCGATAGWSVDVGTARGSLDLFTFTDHKRPERDLRAALGLSRRGNPHGVVGTGVGTWQAGNAHLTGNWTRSGDQPCSDTRQLGAAVLSLAKVGSRMRVEVALAPGSSLVRTSCPGPGVAEGFPPETLAAGTVPLRAFAHRRVVIRLAGASPGAVEGWTGATSAQMTVTLRRVRVRFVKAA